MQLYAGWEVGGVNGNTNDWIVPAPGACLVWQEPSKELGPDWSVRAGQIRNGVISVGISNPMSYNRPQLAHVMKVPFETSGKVFLHSRATDPWIIGEDRAPTWVWAPNFQPVFVDEDNNVVSGLSPKNNRWSASGQINKVYGIPFKERFIAEMNHDEQMGAWHSWRMSVPAVGTHEIYWDDELVYRVVEKDPPAAWWSRPLKAGLRFDFYDYSLKDLAHRQG